MRATAARALREDRDDLRGEMAATRAALCDAVSGLTARLRREGVPPERMFVLVKESVRRGAPSGADVVAVRELMGEAVRCGIRAYYAAA